MIVLNIFFILLNSVNVPLLLSAISVVEVTTLLHQKKELYLWTVKTFLALFYPPTPPITSAKIMTNTLNRINFLFGTIPLRILSMHDGMKVSRRAAVKIA